jgi:hypothetical protein
MRLLRGLVAMISILIAFSSSAECGLIFFEPTVAVGEEYDDNVYLTPFNESADYITHVIPQFRTAYSAPLWDWKIDYAYDYRYYAHDSYQNDHPQKLLLLSTTRIIRDFLYFDINDRYDRTSLTTVQDFSQQSLVKNLTDYNQLDLNPYVALQLTSSLTMTTGYRYRNLWYKDPSAVDQVVHSVYCNLARAVADRTSLTAEGHYDGTMTSVSNQYRTSFLVGARYEYSEGSVLWGSIGAIRSSGSGSTTGTQPAWEVGIIHKKPTLSLSIESGRTYVQDPLVIDRREDRYLGSLSIGTTRTNFGVAVGLRYYSESEGLDERRYSTGLSFGHDLTENLSAKLAVSFDRYVQYPVYAQDIETRVHITDAALQYRLAESANVLLRYVYTDSHSSIVLYDTYTVNRVMIEAKKSF